MEATKYVTQSVRLMGVIYWNIKASMKLVCHIQPFILFSVDLNGLTISIPKLC